MDPGEYRRAVDGSSLLSREDQDLLASEAAWRAKIAAAKGDLCDVCSLPVYFDSPLGRPVTVHGPGGIRGHKDCVFSVQGRQVLEGRRLSALFSA